MARRRLQALVTLDGSVSAESALHWAENLNHLAPCDLILFRVVLPPRAAVLLAPLVGQTQNSASDRIEMVEEYLRGLSINLREKGLQATYETKALEGMDESVAELRAYFTRQVGDMILERSDQGDIDLVILASRGATSQPGVRWGSVANHIISQIRKPILLIPVH